MLYAYLTYITPYTQRNDENLIKLDYSFIRAHHSSYMKPGRVCVYYKEMLSLTLCNFNYLYECICFEAAISNKICNFILPYRSSSQSCDKFENIISNLDLTLETLTQKRSISDNRYWKLQWET